MSENGLVHRKIIVDSRLTLCRIVPPSTDCNQRLPLVLLHGLGCSSAAWAPTLDMLSKKGSERLVVAIDMPGCGHSEGPPRALSIPDLADWLIDLMDQLGISRAHIGGHSMGCQVALEVARRHPERTGGLVLIGPTLGIRVVPLWRYLLGVLINFFLEPARFNILLIRMWLEMGLWRSLAETLVMFADRPLADAKEISPPTLVIRGQYDAIVPDAAARRLALALQNGSYKMAAGCSHAVQFSHPSVFTKLATPFLAQVERNSISPLAHAS